MRQQLALAVAIHRMNFLIDDLDGGIAARDLYHRRGIEQAVGQRLDFS